MASALDAEAAGERWRNAIAELEYAERHGSPTAEVEQLANSVIEARVAMFHAGVAGSRALPAFLHTAQAPAPSTAPAQAQPTTSAEPRCPPPAQNADVALP